MLRQRYTTFIVSIERPIDRHAADQHPSGSADLFM
jgi:hypothetical protein